MSWHTSKILQREVSTVAHTETSQHLWHTHKSAAPITSYHFLVEEKLDDDKTIRYAMCATANDHPEVPLLMVGDTITYSFRHFGQLKVHYDKRP
jgi:hypothetical protein